MSRYFLLILYYNTKLQLSEKNISTHTHTHTHLVKILNRSVKVNQKFKRVLLVFTIPRYTKGDQTAGAMSCAYRCVLRRANSPFAGNTRKSKKNTGETITCNFETCCDGTSVLKNGIEFKHENLLTLQIKCELFSTTNKTISTFVAHFS